MNCPECSWTAVHIHHPPLSAPADEVEQAPVRRPDIPLRAAGTLLDSIIDRLIVGDPATVWHLSPPAPPPPG
jgi:hypothetical protein